MKKLFCAALVAVSSWLGAEDALPPARHEPAPAEEMCKLFRPGKLSEALPSGFASGLLTGGTAAAYNSMTIGWYTFGILWGKEVCTVYVHPDRFTWKFMEKEPVYTVSFYDTPAAEKALLEIFGRKSGRDADKERLSGFTPVSVPGGGVAYLEAKAVIVCRQLAKVPFCDPAVQTVGGAGKTPHTQYIGEILEVWVRK